tara:strand:+ start:7186 stop:7290 length:105 start_codon:yes stop_codon:yes gene_type:complete
MKRCFGEEGRVNMGRGFFGGVQVTARKKVYRKKA